MTPSCALPLAILLLGAALPAAAYAQADVPVPTASPEAPAADSAPGGADRPETPEPAPDTAAAPIGPAALPADGPLPEARPVAPGEATPPPAEAPTEAPAAPVPTPSPASPEAPAAAATPAPVDASEATQPAAPEPAAPQPAYVVPEKARTSPEPSAPQTPAMEVTPAETVEAAAAVEDAIACEGELKARGAVFMVGETIADGDCGVLRPVSLTKLSSGVTIAPGTQFLCRTALALDIWTSDSVVPAAKAELPGISVKAISQASTYVCRARASESKISEHSRGSAIDIAALTLSDGRSLTVEAQAPGSAEDRFTAAIRRGACGPFKTVLGPGTDSDHGTHFHLDIAARSNGSLYCR
ncbi:MAG: extensin family protein [Methylobacterium sp.]